MSWLLCESEDESWCQGSLKGDPDVAGIGVVAATIITTGFAIAVAYLLWYYAIVRKVDTLQARDSTTARISEVPPECKRYQALLKCAFMIADIQWAGLLALSVSSIILINGDAETSLYHVFVARALASLNMLGHGTALMFDTRKQAHWKPRMVVLTATLVLYCYWTGKTIAEFHDWSTAAPRCFYNVSCVPGFYTRPWLYLDIPWTLVGYAWLYLEWTGRCDTWLRDRDASIVGLLVSLKSDVTKFLKHPSLRRAVLTPFKAVAKMLVFVLLALTIQPPSVTPFVSTIFYAWGIYDVVTVRMANQHLLVANPDSSSNTTANAATSLQGNTNPENDWGFGQLLPMILLILPFLQIWDNFAEEPETESFTSVHYLEIQAIRMFNLRPLQQLAATYAPKARTHQREGPEGYRRLENQGRASTLEVYDEGVTTSRPRANMGQ